MMKKPNWKRDKRVRATRLYLVLGDYDVVAMALDVPVQAVKHWVKRARQEGRRSGR